MIRLKSEKEIVILREGGRKLSQILKKIGKEVNPGITTGELESLACQLIKKAGGKPSFKGYKAYPEADPYPTALCTSINNEVVHAPALPSRVLNSGDILKVDVGMEYPFFGSLSARKGYYFSKLNIGERGYYTDMAASIPVGKVDKHIKTLLKITQKSLMLGIRQIRPGKTLYDIARAIQGYIEAHGYSIVRELVGHGVGYEVHEEPQIPNFISENETFPKIILKSGMVLAIEPMVNLGKWETQQDDDGFTIKTLDGSLSSHFEHTVAVTRTGFLVLTE